MIPQLRGTKHKRNCILMVYKSLVSVSLQQIILFISGVYTERLYVRLSNGAFQQYSL